MTEVLSTPNIPDEVETSAGLERLWEAENHRLTLRNVRTLCLIAMVLVPLATVLDFLAYPRLWPYFFFIRSIVSGIEILLLTLSYTEDGKKHYRLLMLLVPLVPAMGIAWMIFQSGDPASPYYAGLTLCLVGVGFLYQWSYKESIIAVVITLVLYLAATIPNLRGDTSSQNFMGDFVNNGVFLLLNSVVIITGSLVHHRIRRNEVISRFALAENRKELEQINLDLVEMDRLKTDFFSNITHELRTPLTLMLAPLQRLLRLHTAEQDHGGHQHSSELNSELSGIYQNALRLLKLINDLLDISSADAGSLKTERRRFTLNSFLDRLSNSIANMARQGGVTMRLKTLTYLHWVEADEDKLERILLNLLFNAVKFTPAGGRVTLTAREDAGRIIFEVADTGIGISEKSLPYIFDRFWQADTSATRQHPGTGLGLSLVKEFAHQMGGHAEAQSRQGKGTLMRIILPLMRKEDTGIIGVMEEKIADTPAEQNTGNAEAHSASAAWINSIYREADRVPFQIQEEPAAAPVSSVSTEATNGDRSRLPLVLIADDEPGMLRFMRQELEPHFRIIPAQDGRAALEAAAEHQPDLIIADFMMPNLDGLALCRELRARPASVLTPIILVTARSDEEVRLTALRNGANDVLVKPFSLTEFHTRAHGMVQRRLLQKEVEARNAELEKTLTELRTAEHELIQSEKMAALGILTGGIMHEINNPLNFTRSALYVLDRRAAGLPKDHASDISGIVADLREGINRISTIVADMRNFCHPQTLLASACPVTEPLQSAVRLLAGPLRNSSVEFQEDVAPDVQVRGDKNQLTLVFLNLLKNAIDALASSPPHNGDGAWIRVSARASGLDDVEIKISDNGPGIATENLGRVFDPFFTTKAPGEGTGLGLSVCYRIITAHGGTISVQPRNGCGTEFTVKLSQARPVLSA